MTQDHGKRPRSPSDEEDLRPSVERHGAADEGPSRVYQRRRLAAPEGEGGATERRKRRGSRAGQGRRGRGRGQGANTEHVRPSAPSASTTARGAEHAPCSPPIKEEEPGWGPQPADPTFRQRLSARRRYVGVGRLGVLPLDARIIYDPCREDCFIGIAEAQRLNLEVRWRSGTVSEPAPVRLTRGLQVTVMGTVQTSLRVGPHDAWVTLGVIAEDVGATFGAPVLRTLGFYEDNIRTILRDRGTTPRGWRDNHL